MKSLLNLIVIIVISVFTTVKTHACTSFAVYSNETWYGMNFDYPDTDIKFLIYHVGNKKVFKAEFGSGGYIAGMNDSGLFTNYQMLYYNNGEPTFENGSNTISIGALNDYSIDNFSTVTQITGYIGSKKLVPSFNQDLHTLYADKFSNAMVAEPFGPYNGITPVEDNFIVMTNLPNYAFIGMDYTSVYGVGGDRYQTAFAYIKDHKTSFGYENAFETLRQTVQSSGDYPTQISLIFDPVNQEIFFCLKRDSEQVGKISLQDETIETYSGYPDHIIHSLGPSGIWSYELTEATNIEDNELIKSCSQIGEIVPNHSSGLFNITFNSAPVEEATIEVYNTNGELIILKAIKNEANATFDLKGNPKGIYFVKLFNNGKMKTVKLFLE
jgi:hypothetical protein